MKISNATKAALLAAKQTNASKAQPATIARKAVKAVSSAKKAKKAKKQAATVKASELALILLSGARGYTSRNVRKITMSDGEVRLYALQNNMGMANKSENYGIDNNGLLTGKRDGLIELGGYVNGKTSGASVRYLTAKQFNSIARPCIVKWNQDDNGIAGRYIGNPAEKGMSAVVVSYKGGDFHWQMETDANANNKHERGDLLPSVKGGKLLPVKL